jgi:hypothetical protein
MTPSRSPLSADPSPRRCPAAAVCLVLAAAGLALGACGTVGPKPWERDLMARPDMALDAAPVDSAIDDHVYFSKEGASGGRGFGGGGCGCN